MKPYLLTLIQTSQNRINEVKRFVESLNSQVGIDFDAIQYIFVDQGNHKCAFDNLNADISFEYMKSEKCSLSYARNLALTRVKGRYVAFPDDDCWYEFDTLSKVINNLLYKGYDGVSGIGYNSNGILTSTFPKKSTELSKQNLCAAISYTLFLRYDSTVKFDENIGVGSPYGIGSGEESDYLLTLLKKNNYCVLYDPSIVVYHPAELDSAFDDVALMKVYNYAIGDGYLYKKHKMPIFVVLMSLLRPLVGMCFFACLIKPYESRRSYFRLKGRIKGLMFKL